MPLRQTYELHLASPAGTRSIEVLTCLQHELISRMRRLLEDRELETVEARHNGSLLLTLARPEQPPH